MEIDRTALRMAYFPVRNDFAKITFKLTCFFAFISQQFKQLAKGTYWLILLPVVPFPLKT